MGPPDISIPWRVCFIVFIVVNVFLRSISMAFAGIMMWESGYTWAGHKVLPIIAMVIGSYAVTLLFVFKLQGKHLTISTLILSFIMWLSPVEIDEFTVLKTAMPRSPQLPFALVRYAEIIACCAFFAATQSTECRLRSSVDWLYTGSTSSNANHSKSILLCLFAKYLNSQVHCSTTATTAVMV